MKTEARKHRLAITAVVVSALLLSAAPSHTQDQMIDVVYLNDGTKLQGLIVEQTAGVSLKLSTAERIVYTLANEEIDRVEKQKTREPLPFSYIDVVLLKDGVMFSGTIVEQRPAESITLETQNGYRLPIATEEIWKIRKQKQVSGVAVVEDEERERAEREGFRIALQLQLVRKRINRQQRGRGSGGSGPELEEEIENLKDEIEELEDLEEQIEYEFIQDRREQERRELESLMWEVQQLLEEIVEMLEQCGKRTEDQQALGPMFRTPRRRELRVEELSPIADDFESQLLVADKQSDEELAEQLDEAISSVVETSLARIPTREALQALESRQQAYTELTLLLSGSRWHRSRYAGDIRDLSAMITLEERVYLYDTFRKKDMGLAMALNAVPLFYIGSWVQGNGWGAVFGIAQTYITVSGAGALLDDDAVSKGYTSYLDQGYLFADMGTNGWLGIAAVGISYTLGIIQPLIYSKRMNNRLQRRLELENADIRAVEREKRKAALNPPAVWIVPCGEEDLGIQLDLVSFSY